MEKKLIESGKLSDEQLAALKVTYGTVKTLEVFIDDEETGEIVEKVFGYLKNPDRDTVAVCLSLLTQQKPLQAGELIIANSWVGGDERLKDHSTFLGISASNIARSMPVFYSGRLKN